MDNDILLENEHILKQIILRYESKLINEGALIGNDIIKYYQYKQTYNFIYMLNRNMFDKRFLDIMFSESSFIRSVDLKKFQRHIIEQFYMARKMFPKGNKDDKQQEPLFSILESDIHSYYLKKYKDVPPINVLELSLYLESKIMEKFNLLEK